MCVNKIVHKYFDLGKDLRFSVASKYADDTKNTAKIGNTDDSKDFQKKTR